MKNLVLGSLALLLVTVALALNQGITALASADRDFERVEELVVYSPTDIADRA